MNMLSSTDILIAVAQRASGLRYDSAEASTILDTADANWDSHWPMVDGSGRLTGEVVETDDWTDDHLNVMDSAAIMRGDAQAAGWMIDAEGCAFEPAPAATVGEKMPELV